jgi:hypothetical protein
MTYWNCYDRKRVESVIKVRVRHKRVFCKVPYKGAVDD